MKCGAFYCFHCCVFVHYLDFYGPCIVLSIVYMIYNFLAMHFSILYILLIISIVYNCIFLLEVYAVYVYVIEKWII